MMRLLQGNAVVSSLIVMLGFWRPASAQDAASLIAHIKAVGKEGKGNVEANKAWRSLVEQGPDALPQVLAGLDDASPIAANWLRAAAEVIADRGLRSEKLSASELESFVRDTRHAGAARRLAFEWLVKVDAKAKDRMLPGMIDDPGAELRREAIEVLLKKAQETFEKKDETGARSEFQKVLAVARDYDQVKLAAARLEKLGIKTDLTARFGYITRWTIVGPFDNSGGAGFNTVNPPERGVDLKARYTGKDDQKLQWQEHVTTAALGLVDLNKVVGKLHGTTAFAFAAIESPQESPVEIRVASNNALRIFLNGKEIFFREEYHHGMQMDQHVGKGTLKAGRNEVLLKICQNEQTEDWAQLWSFQARICDALGGPVPYSVVTAKLGNVE
jgi:hypothetical protein